MVVILHERYYSKRIFRAACAFFLLFILQLKIAFSQSAWPSVNWEDAVNLTGIMDTNGLTELSGLHWNPVMNRLYVAHGNGKLRVLQLNTTDSTFTQIAFSSNLESSEGITQMDYLANEFFTIEGISRIFGTGCEPTIWCSANPIDLP